MTPEAAIDCGLPQRHEGCPPPAARHRFAMAPQKSHQLTMQTLTHLRSIFVVEDSSGANEQDFVAVRPSQAPPKIGDPGRIDQVWLRGEGSIERRKRQPDSLPDRKSTRLNSSH